MGLELEARTQVISLCHIFEVQRLSFSNFIMTVNQRGSYNRRNATKPAHSRSKRRLHPLARFKRMTNKCKVRRTKHDLKNFSTAFSLSAVFIAYPDPDASFMDLPDSFKAKFEKLVMKHRRVLLKLLKDV